MAKRTSPIAKVRVGNYKQYVDTTGVMGEMGSVFGTPYTKEEAEYVKGKGGSASSKEAVRRARRANKQYPPRENE